MNSCDRNGCGRFHSRFLHGCSTPGLNLHIHMGDCHLEGDKFPGMMDSQGSAMLLIQDVKLHVDQMTKYFGTAAAPQSLLNKNLQKTKG